MDRKGAVRMVSARELGFDYRTSRLNGDIVLEAVWGLVSDDKQAIEERVKRLWEFKKRTQDWSAPSVGCIFKNPKEGKGAGWMVDQVGLKGRQVGGAMVSPRHANFILNTGNARAADVFSLIEEARSRVLKRFGVELETEVQILP